MKTITDLNELLIEEETAVALGNFDGLHVGHKVILEDAVNSAAENDCKSLCFTFSNHPFNFIMNRDVEDEDALKYILTEEEKIKHIEEMGFDYLVNVPFDEKMMKMSAEDFFNDILLASLNASIISVGFNYTYGARAVGTAETLYREGENTGIEVHVHDAVKLYHEVVSSTLIRETIAEADMEMVSALLGRDYYISGEVVRGNSVGRSEGFPTINTKVPGEQIIPPKGVYFGNTIINGESHRCIINLGNKPTFGQNDLGIEAHLFDFDRDVYGETACVCLKHFIRHEKKFDSVDSLYKQILMDCELAKNFEKA